MKQKNRLIVPAPHIRRIPRAPQPQQQQGLEALGFAAVTAFSASTGIILGPTAFFTAAGVVTAAATIGVSLALSAAATALAGSAKQSALTGGQGVSLADNGLRVPVRQPIPPQRLALGSVTTSIAWFFNRSDPPNIWIGGELASHPCGELLGVTLNGTAVPIDADGLPTSAPYYNGTTHFLEVSYRDGSAGQAIDPIIARDFPTMPASFAQKRATTIVVKAAYGASDNAHKDIYGSENNFNLLVRFQGARLPDPRVPGFDPENEDTWVAGSSNASLGLIRYLIHAWPNMRLVNPNEFDWDKIAEAAEIDDQWKGKSDGTIERNHTCDGVILSTDDPLETCKRILTSLDGVLINSKGKYYTVPGAPREPTFTIHQDMIAGGFEVQTEAADRDLINIVKTEMVAPDRDYNTVVGPVIRREDLILVDGRALETTLSLPFTEGDARAQRFGNRKLIETRSGRGLSGLFTIEARDLEAGQVVRVDFRDFPEVNGIYQIRKKGRDQSLTNVQLSMVAWSNERFEYHAPSQQQAFELDQDVLDAEAA